MARLMMWTTYLGKILRNSRYQERVLVDAVLALDCREDGLRECSLAVETPSVTRITRGSMGRNSRCLINCLTPSPEAYRIIVASRRLCRRRGCTICPRYGGRISSWSACRDVSSLLSNVKNSLWLNIDEDSFWASERDDSADCSSVYSRSRSMNVASIAAWLGTSWSCADRRSSTRQSIILFLLNVSTKAEWLGRSTFSGSISTSICGISIKRLSASQ